MSYSSLSKYLDCGEKYRLERYKLADQDYYASAGGTVIHQIVEDLELSGDRDVDPDLFEHLFVEEVVRREQSGLLLPSGKEQKEFGWNGGPNKKDALWWLYYGPQIVQAYVRWRNETSWQLWGEPEIEFDIEIAGVQVIGKIDQVRYDPSTDAYICNDVKTGNDPPSKLQLGIYQIALEQMFGIHASAGAFIKPWSAKEYETVIGPRGGRSKRLVSEEIRVSANPFPLSFDTEQIGKLVSDARRNIEHGVFMASPGPGCSYCPVKDYCWIMGGERAMALPLHDEIEISENIITRNEEEEDGEQ